MIFGSEIYFKFCFNGLALPWLRRNFKNGKTFGKVMTLRRCSMKSEIKACLSEQLQKNLGYWMKLRATGYTASRKGKKWQDLVESEPLQKK